MTRSADPQQWECPEARIALGVYVLGALDPAEQALVEAHLDRCDDCLAEMAGLADLTALLDRVPVDEAVRALEAGEAPAAPEAQGTERTLVVLEGGKAATEAPRAAASEASEDKRGRADRSHRTRGVRGVGVYPPGSLASCETPTGWRRSGRRKPR